MAMDENATALFAVPREELRRVARAAVRVAGTESQLARILLRELKRRGCRMTAQELREALGEHDPTAEAIVFIPSTEAVYYAIEEVVSGAEPRTVILHLGERYSQFPGSEDTNEQVSGSRD